jgi:hypothetical protein
LNCHARDPKGAIRTIPRFTGSLTLSILPSTTAKFETFITLYQAAQSSLTPKQFRNIQSLKQCANDLASDATTNSGSSLGQILEGGYSSYSQCKSAAKTIFGDGQKSVHEEESHLRSIADSMAGNVGDDTIDEILNFAPHIRGGGVRSKRFRRLRWQRHRLKIESLSDSLAGPRPRSTTFLASARTVVSGWHSIRHASFASSFRSWERSSDRRRAIAMALVVSPGDVMELALGGTTNSAEASECFFEGLERIKDAIADHFQQLCRVLGPRMSKDCGHSSSS